MRFKGIKFELSTPYADTFLIKNALAEPFTGIDAVR